MTTADVRANRAVRTQRMKALLDGTQLYWVQTIEDPAPHLCDEEGNATPALVPEIVAAVDALPDELVKPFALALYATLSHAEQRSYDRGELMGRQRQLAEVHKVLGVSAIRDAILEGARVVTNTMRSTR